MQTTKTQPRNANCVSFTLGIGTQAAIDAINAASPSFFGSHRNEWLEIALAEGIAAIARRLEANGGHLALPIRFEVLEETVGARQEFEEAAIVDETRTVAAIEAVLGAATGNDGTV